MGPAPGVPVAHGRETSWASSPPRAVLARPGPGRAIGHCGAGGPIGPPGDWRAVGGRGGPGRHVRWRRHGHGGGGRGGITGTKGRETGACGTGRRERRDGHWRAPGRPGDSARRRGMGRRHAGASGGDIRVLRQLRAGPPWRRLHRASGHSRGAHLMRRGGPARPVPGRAGPGAGAAGGVGRPGPVADTRGVLGVLDGGGALGGGGVPDTGGLLQSPPGLRPGRLPGHPRPGRRHRGAGRGHRCPAGGVPWLAYRRVLRHAPLALQGAGDALRVGAGGRLRVGQRRPEQVPHSGELGPPHAEQRRHPHGPELRDGRDTHGRHGPADGAGDPPAPPRGGGPPARAPDSWRWWTPGTAGSGPCCWGT